MPRRLPAYRPGVRMMALSGTALHWIGFALMCLSSFSAAILQRAVLHLDGSASLEALGEAMKPGGEAMGWATGAVMCSLAAALAIPIYAKLLYEGCRRTEDAKGYLLGLAACAVVSEAPYDFAMSGRIFEWGVQNPVWGLLLSGIMLVILRRWKFPSKAADLAFKALVVVAAIAWALLLRVYMGAMVVLLVALFYFAGKREAVALLGGTIITILQFPAPVGLVFAHWYSGEKGKSSDGRLFYILYPVQLLVFGVLGAVLGG